jgi:hypothetical protein
MNCAVCNTPVYDNFANGLCGNCLQDWKAQNLYQKKSVAQPIIGGMEMTIEEIATELKARIEDLRPYIDENDSDSEYFQGVQEGYILSLAMLTGEIVEGTILPYQ